MTRNAKGFNLIESAIVLGVVGLVLGGIWIAASSVRESNLQRQLISGTMVIAENIRKMYKGVPPSTLSGGVTFADGAAWHMGIYQGAEGWSLNTASNSVYHPAGNMTLAGFPFGGSQIMVALAGLSRDRCIRLVSSIVGATWKSGLAQVTIQGVAYTSFPFVATTTQCSSATSNLVGFIFER